TESTRRVPRDHSRPRRSFGDQFDRRDRDFAARHLPGLLGIMLEEVPLLQRLDRRIVGGRGEMPIAGIVAILQAAVDDTPPQLRVIVEGCNEATDFPVPLLGGAVGELIFDHEMLHRCLPVAASNNLVPYGTHAQVWTKLIVWTFARLLLS